MADVIVEVDVDGVERFLREHPPTSLVALSDRLLIASVVPRDEGPALAQRFFPDVLAAAQSGIAAQQLTTLCVLCATMEELGVDVSDLRFSLALVARVIGVPEHEPFRSTGRYWLWRASLARSFDVDRAAPGARFFDFAFFSHCALFATAYGKSPVAAPAGFADAVASVDVDDGDSVAVLLLCAMGVTPMPDVARFWSRLAELQQDDGAFATRVDGEVARHHAACAAWLALALNAQRQPR